MGSSQKLKVTINRWGGQEYPNKDDSVPPLVPSCQLLVIGRSCSSLTSFFVQTNCAPPVLNTSVGGCLAFSHWSQLFAISSLSWLQPVSALLLLQFKVNIPLLATEIFWKREDHNVRKSDIYDLVSSTFHMPFYETLILICFKATITLAKGRKRPLLCLQGEVSLRRFCFLRKVQTQL